MGPGAPTPIPMTFSFRRPACLLRSRRWSRRVFSSFSRLLTVKKESLKIIFPPGLTAPSLTLPPPISTPIATFFTIARPKLKDRLFSDLIEKVGFAHVQHEIQILIDAGADMSRDARDEGIGPRPQIKIGLGAHRFHNLAGRPDRIVRRGLGRKKLVINVFGADPKDDLLILVSGYFRHRGVNDPYFKHAALKVKFILRARDLPFKKIHRRTADEPRDKFIDRVVIQRDRVGDLLDHADPIAL